MADNTWTNTGDRAWDTNANWSLGHPPTDDETAVISCSAANLPQGSGGDPLNVGTDWTVAALEISVTSGAGVLQFSTDGSSPLTVQSVTVTPAGGSVAVSGILLDGAAAFSVGAAAGGGGGGSGYITPV